MNRQQKEAVVASLNKKFQDANAVFLVNYRGLNVGQLQDLRTQLRAANASMKVTKARLMKLAVQGVEGASDLEPILKDQIGLVFADDEVSSVAKAMVQFSKKNESLSFVGGLFEAGVLTEEQIKFLASLPSREVLVAQLLGTLQAPISGFARTLNMLLVNLLCVLSEIEKKKSK